MFVNVLATSEVDCSLCLRSGIENGEYKGAPPRNGLKQRVRSSSFSNLRKILAIRRTSGFLHEQFVFEYGLAKFLDASSRLAPLGMFTTRFTIPG